MWQRTSELSKIQHLRNTFRPNSDPTDSRGCSFRWRACAFRIPEQPLKEKTPKYVATITKGSTLLSLESIVVPIRRSLYVLGARLFLLAPKQLMIGFRQHSSRCSQGDYVCPYGNLCLAISLALDTSALF